MIKYRPILSIEQILNQSLIRFRKLLPESVLSEFNPPHLDIISNHCWLLMRNDKNNIIQLEFAKKAYTASHLMYRLYFGEFPSGKYIYKSCGNNKCMNPRHFIIPLWDQRNPLPQNLKKYNHKGQQHHSAKLNPEKVKRIRHLFFNSDLSYSQIAQLFDVSKSAIGQIINGKSWKHIK